MGLLYRLKANTSKSNVDAEFSLSDDKTDFYLVVYGKHDGEQIQIDFNTLKREDISELIDYLKKVQDTIQEPSKK